MRPHSCLRLKRAVTHLTLNSPAHGMCSSLTPLCPWCARQQNIRSCREEREEGFDRHLSEASEAARALKRAAATGSPATGEPPSHTHTTHAGRELPAAAGHCQLCARKYS